MTSACKWLTLQIPNEDHAAYAEECRRQSNKQLRHVTITEVARKEIARGAVRLRSRHRAQQ